MLFWCCYFVCPAEVGIRGGYRWLVFRRVLFRAVGGGAGLREVSCWGAVVLGRWLFGGGGRVGEVSCSGGVVFGWYRVWVVSCSGGVVLGRCRVGEASLLPGWCAHQNVSSELHVWLWKADEHTLRLEDTLM